jgi:hypothetical protein
MSIAGSSSGDVWKMSPSKVGSEESAVGPRPSPDAIPSLEIRLDPETTSRFRISAAGNLLFRARGQSFAPLEVMARRCQTINPRRG